MDCDEKPFITWYECEKSFDPRGEEYNEYYQAQLSCPTGQVVEIKSSLYGRATTEVCSLHDKSNGEDKPYRMYVSHENRAEFFYAQDFSPRIFFMVTFLMTIFFMTTFFMATFFMTIFFITFLCRHFS